MGRGGFARGAGLAGVQQHDRLAQRSRAARGGEEAARLAELLDDHGDDLRRIIVQQIVDIILDARRGLIPGRHREAEAKVAAGEGGAQHAGHGPALRHDADALAVTQRGRVRFHEGQRHPVDEIGHAQAIGAFDDHAGLRGDAADLALLGQALLAAFGKAGRKDDGGPDPARGERLHRVEHGRARDGEHGRIHAFGQGVDRWQAGPPANLRPLGVDEVDVAGKAVARKVGEDRCAQRAGLVGRADDHDRARPQQPVERLMVSARRIGGRRVQCLDRHGVRLSILLLSTGAARHAGRPGCRVRRSASTCRRRPGRACSSCRR